MSTEDDSSSKSSETKAPPTATGKHVLVFDSKRVPVAARVSKSTTDERNVVATYDRFGNHIYVGSTRGAISIYKQSAAADGSGAFEFVRAYRLPCAQEIKQIAFSPNGDHYLINCHDRVIRVFDAHTYALNILSYILSHCLYTHAHHGANIIVMISCKNSATP